MLDIRPLIHRKLQRKTLSPSQIREFVAGVIAGEIPDYQVSAFLMAIVHVGLSLKETVELTREMAEQGERLPKSARGSRIGKHSTGGVGDKTTFLLGPIVSQYGLEVSFMSGRGLGHTGGTIDKLSGIKGLKTALAPAEVRRLLKKAGFAIFEQTKKIAPADRRLYALRDLSGTVASVPLIVSSILSKKMAEGLHGLVLDVKYGSGSFLGEIRRARELTRWLLKVAKALGLKATAVLTSMDEPLGIAVGNNHEIEESLQTLRGHGPKDLVEVTYRLAREMLRIAFPRRKPLDRKSFNAFLASGKGAEHLMRGLRHQGANWKHSRTLQKAPRCERVAAPKAGFIQRIDARSIGEVCMELGAGRKRAGEPIDPRVGLRVLKKVGEPVKKGETIFEVGHASAAVFRSILPKLLGAVTIATRRKAPPRLIAGIYRNFKD